MGKHTTAIWDVKTPKTDYFVNRANMLGITREDAHEKLIDLARSLERERNELWTALNEMKLAFEIYASTPGQHGALSTTRKAISTIRKGWK
jgi:hypothetical protein